MKWLVLSMCFVCIAGICMADDYGKGYQEGYKKGYQYQESGGIEPIAPIPPIPPIPAIGERGYDDGYRRGVIEGHEERVEN
jgi:hypothetical protein